MKKFLLRRNAYLLVTVIVILVGTIGVLTLSGAGSAISASVVASGLVSLFYLYSQYIEDADRVLHRAVDEAGVLGISPTRRIDYATPMQHTKERVDVMGYSLRSFTDDHAAALIAKRGGSFQARILVVSPDDPASSRQEHLEGHAPGTFDNAVQRLVAKFKSAAPGVQIRAVSHALPTMIFRMDGVMFVGPYFIHEPSAQTVTLELDQGGWMFKHYEAEFEKQWESGTALN